MNEKNKSFKKGDRVVWTYRHWLNSKSSTLLQKDGTFIETTGKKKNKRYVSGTHAKVHFDGNKHPSVVPIKELKIASE